MFSVVLLTALTQVYTWTDKQGVAHYTDDPNSVPAKVKARITEGDEISTVSLPDLPKKEAVKSPEPAPIIAPNDPAKLEREWRAAFRDVNERVARLEDEIELDRHKVEDVNGLPVAARYQCLFNSGAWYPAGGVVSTGSGVSVTASGTSQGVPGFTVGTGVVLRQSSTVVTTPGIATAPCVFTLNPEHERAKERLALNRRALERLKIEQADLERRASFEGVPQEWRR